MLLSEHYRDPSWPRGWHIYRVEGYRRWRLLYWTGRQWLWVESSSDKGKAIAQMGQLARKGK